MPSDAPFADLDEELRRWRESAIRRLADESRERAADEPLRLDRTAALALWAFLILSIVLVFWALALGDPAGPR